MSVVKSLAVIEDNLVIGLQLVVKIQRGDKLALPEVTLLVRTLRAAACAANELEQRTLGTPEPKRGD